MRRFLTVVTALALGLSLAGAPAYAAGTPQCKTGKLCGKACIPKEKQCTIGSTASAASKPAAKPAAKTVAAASSVPAAAPKRCKDAKGQKFVKCGTPGSKPV